jgi:hypothetical protein
MRVKSNNLLGFLAVVLVAAGLAGCASTPSQNRPEKKPPKADRVQVLRYDTTPRPATTHLDVYELAPPEKPHKVIALLTCEGRVDQEVVMSTAILYRARQIGADAVMRADKVTSRRESFSFNRYGGGGLSEARCVFTYRALVYDSK